MTILDRVASGLVLRRLLTEVQALRAGIERHNALLERLADKFAPVPPAVRPAELADTGLSFVDGGEQAKVDQILAAARKSGRPEPSDEEIDAILREDELAASGGGGTLRPR
jgi:hypothetical protein